MKRLILLIVGLGLLAAVRPVKQYRDDLLDYASGHTQLNVTDETAELDLFRDNPDPYEWQHGPEAVVAKCKASAVQIVMICALFGGPTCLLLAVVWPWLPKRRVELSIVERAKDGEVQA